MWWICHKSFLNGTRTRRFEIFFIFLKVIFSRKVVGHGIKRMDCCHVSFDVGIRNLAVAIIVVDNNDKIEVLLWKVIDLLEHTGAKKIKNVDLARRIRLLHNECKQIWSCLNNFHQTYVHIERQHARNHGMTAMAVALFVEALASLEPVHIDSKVHVDFIPAKSKLDYASRVLPNIITADAVNAARGKRQYKLRKKLAICACQALLENHEIYMTNNTTRASQFFEQIDRSKVDDLADSMLQALSCANVLPILTICQPIELNCRKRKQTNLNSKRKPKQQKCTKDVENVVTKKEKNES